ncbi:hypothetical protein ACFL1L_04395 [Thermoplasmatota archaeon]
MKNKLFKNFIIIFMIIITNLSIINNVFAESDNLIENDTNFYPRKLLSSYKNNEDIDPLINLEVTVDINEIRAFDIIDKKTDPDFYARIFINGEEFRSPIWKNQKYLSNLNWSCTLDVPDDQEFVEIIIQLWDWNIGRDTLCDIALNDNENPNRKDLSIIYSIKTGHWFGDDMIYLPHSWSVDMSGYGRGNGCDDNSIYEDDNDCEIYFDIKQNDYDGDEIPYWTETEMFNTDPTVDDRGRDDDNDNIPIEWENKWGHQFDWEYDELIDQYVIYHTWFYDPFKWDDHQNIDTDNDALNNLEEYLTCQWGSDPFRKDIFVEIDQMNAGSIFEKESVLPDGSKHLIRNAFNRQNIIFHLDDGSWVGETGSESVPFDDVGEKSTWEEVDLLYRKYFLHDNEHNWRRGVFHYGVVIYNAEGASGYCFRSDAFQISRVGMEKKVLSPVCGSRDVVYASAYMHELGHSLGLVFLGGHSRDAYFPWQPLWWKFRPYKSIMNYGYMYGFLHDLVDYSDGSRGKNDFNDWENIDFYNFQSYF